MRRYLWSSLVRAMFRVVCFRKSPCRATFVVTGTSPAGGEYMHVSKLDFTPAISEKRITNCGCGLHEGCWRLDCVMARGPCLLSQALEEKGQNPVPRHRYPVETPCWRWACGQSSSPKWHRSER